jgi:hypothetical protein
MRAHMVWMVGERRCLWRGMIVTCGVELWKRSAMSCGTVDGHSTSNRRIGKRAKRAGKTALGKERLVGHEKSSNRSSGYGNRKESSRRQRVGKGTIRIPLYVLLKQGRG